MNLHRPPRPSLQRSRFVVASVLAALVWVSPVAAQSEPWREVGNPYQEDLNYEVGTTLAPRVEIEGVRWRSLRIETAADGAVAAGEDVDVEVAVEFENRNPSGVKLLVILLLEDAEGAPLERIELGTFKVGGERLKERTETEAVTGDVLLAVRKVYLFCEVMS